MEKQIINQLKKYNIKVFKDCYIIDSLLLGKKQHQWNKETAQLHAISETLDFLWIQSR